MMALDISLPFPGLFSAWAGSAKRYWVTLAKRRRGGRLWVRLSDQGEEDAEWEGDSREMPIPESMSRS